MVKRASSLSPPPSKKQHLDSSFSLPYVASPEAADAADANPPLGVLLQTLKEVPSESPEIGDAVAYWMRMEDMRSESTLLSILCLLKVCHQSVITVLSPTLLLGRFKITFHFSSFLY
jgi:hypothetical protein